MKLSFALCSFEKMIIMFYVLPRRKMFYEAQKFQCFCGFTVKNVGKADDTQAGGFIRRRLCGNYYIYKF